MTDQLTTLLRREADELLIPVAPVDDVMSAGRTARRRRRTSHVLTAAAAVALVGAGITTIQHRGSASTFEPVSPTGRLVENAGAISLDSTVYLDNGRLHAALPQPSAGVFYTSAGVLVRTSDNGHTETGDPYRFTLVGPQGETARLGLTIDRGGLDAVPSQPYLVRTEVHDGTVDVVVDDVSTDREVARVSLPGHPTWRKYSAAPPVSLDGDTAYVATEGTAYAVQWRTGRVTPNHVIGPEYGPVRGGHVVDPQGRVLDVRTGRTLLHYGSANSRGVLSWDGRYLIDTYAGPFTAQVYDVATGHRVELRKVSVETWTPDGHVFGTEFHGGPLKLAVCRPDTGGCTTHAIPTPDTREFTSIVGGEWFQ